MTRIETLGKCHYFNVVFWAAAGACHVRSSTLLTTSMVGALAALGVLQAGSRVAAGGGSIALIWVGCALFGSAALCRNGLAWPSHGLGSGHFAQLGFHAYFAQLFHRLPLCTSTVGRHLESTKHVNSSDSSVGSTGSRFRRFSLWVLGPWTLDTTAVPAQRSRGRCGRRWSPCSPSTGSTSGCTTPSKPRLAVPTPRNCPWGPRNIYCCTKLIKIVRGWPKLWANFMALIGIFSQSVEPSLVIWANPVQF